MPLSSDVTLPGGRRADAARPFPVAMFSAAALAVAAIIYLIGTLPHLGAWPPVGEDEPWIASGAWELATTGQYASHLFAGYAKSETRLTPIAPLHGVVLSGVFATLGTGVARMRLLTVAAGLGILLLTWLLGRLLLNDRAAAIGVLLLSLLPIAAGGGGTGIPLIDISRICRPDALAAMLGLAGFLLFERAERQGGQVGHALAGALIGLGITTHPVAGFWVPAILLLMLLRRGHTTFRRREPWQLALGVALALLPLAIDLAMHWPLVLAQARPQAARFAVADPHFYPSNLLREYHRYGSLLGSSRVPGPSLTLAAICLVAAMVAALRPLRSQGPLDGGASLAIALGAQVIFLALLISQKTFNYTIGLMPPAMLLISWIGCRWWERYPRWPVRALLLLALATVVADGAHRISRDRRMAAEATPYDRFEERIARVIPPGSRVLGLQHYWLGLRSYDYRTWLVPIYHASPELTHAPMPLDEAIEQVAPDVILIDRHMRSYLDELADPANPRHHQLVELRRYAERHGMARMAIIEDATYGRMDVYRTRREPSP